MSEHSGMYYQVNISTYVLVGQPIFLPSYLQGLADISLQDLNWIDVAFGFSGCGLWPITDVTPTFDASISTLDTTYTFTIDKVNRLITATQNTRSLTSSEIAANQAAAAAAAALALTDAKNVQTSNVNNYIDTLINNGVVIYGQNFQIDDSSRANITSMGALAVEAISTGSGNAGNLRWFNSNVDFGWITTANTVYPMDAPTTFAFSKTVAVYYSSLIFIGREMKNTILALNDVNLVNSFVITNGWPSNAIS